MSDLMQTIQGIMEENRVAVFGTGPACTLENAPAGYRPTETARSIGRPVSGIP